MNGYYQVSNLGNVRSLDRIVKDTTKDRTQKLKGKVLKKPHFLWGIIGLLRLIIMNK